jgi:hypothetical protein
VRVLEQLFAPSQILVFLLEERINKLKLVRHVGLSVDPSKPAIQIDFGEGPPRLGGSEQD